MTPRVQPRAAARDYAAVALETGYPIHVVKSRGAAFCRAHPRTAEPEDDYSQLPPIEVEPGVDELPGDIDRALDEAFADPDLVWAGAAALTRRERARALIVVGVHGLVPIGCRTTSQAQRPLTAEDDLLAIVEHNLALLDIEALDEAAPLSRRRQADHGRVVDERPDPVAARERRRASLERLRDEEIARRDAAFLAAEAAPSETNETAVAQQVRG